MRIEDLENEFCELLDEIYSPFKIGNLEYPASETFKDVDPIAFNQEFLNWLDAEGWDEDKDGLYKKSVN